MASSQVESTRLLHQEVEQHMREMVQDLLRDGKTTKDRILNDHRVARRLGVLVETGQKILESYDDPDGLRKQELEDISGENVGVFYDRLKALREHHRKFPGAAVKADPTYELKLKVKFSSEEAHGKFLDLHTLFERFLNMPVFERCDYLQYLRIFDKFDTISREDKLTGEKGLQYRKYLEDMLTYVKGFLNRVHPLVSMDKLEKMVEEDFKVRWEAKAIPAWFEAKRPATRKRRRGGFDSAPGPERPELSSETSVEEKEKEKEKLDPETLEANPLYCKPCEKLFSKETTFTAHLKGRPHKKAVERKAVKAPTNTTQVKKEVLSRLLALMEEKIGRFVELLKEELTETQKRVERKQTQTLDEIQADLEEQSDEEEVGSDSDNETEKEKPLYNPLNLPLGWDGKPIPYWLYKLHGLNIEYKCEICGDYSYWGPRAFERHFKEWRHAYGMRCLNIPNTKHFMNITTFKDARILHEKLKRELSQSGWKPEEEEEFEDAEGNVFNKKTYDDLRRQGLV